MKQNRAVTQSKSVPLGINTEIVGPAKTRKAITFFPPNQIVQIGLENITPSPNSGCTIGPSTPPLTLTRDIHGDIVMATFFAYAPFSAVTLMYSEVFEG